MSTRPVPSTREQQLRSDVHETMARTKVVLDELGSFDALVCGDIDTAEHSFEQLAAELVELAARVTELREVPGLTVEGALVAGSVETALVVLRSTLASIQAGLDHARGEAA